MFYGLHTFHSEVGLKIPDSLCQQAPTIWELFKASWVANLSLWKEDQTFITNLTAFQNVPNSPYFINNTCNFAADFMAKTFIFSLSYWIPIMPTVLISHLHWFKLAQLIFLLIILLQ